MQVAGLHRAVPSATLDKAMKFFFLHYISFFPIVNPPVAFPKNVYLFRKHFFFPLDIGFLLDYNQRKH